MTENPIVKMASVIRDKVGTTKKFTLPEIALLMELKPVSLIFRRALPLAKTVPAKALTARLTSMAAIQSFILLAMTSAMATCYEN